MVVAETLICSAWGLWLAKRKLSQVEDGAKTAQHSGQQRSSLADGCQDRKTSSDCGSTTASTAASTSSSSSVCRMGDNVAEWSASQPRNSAAASCCSLESMTTPFLLFACARCARGIAEDEPVHMCGDESYCSRECRIGIGDGDAPSLQEEWCADSMYCDVQCISSRPFYARAPSMLSLALLYGDQSAFTDTDSEFD